MTQKQSTPQPPSPTVVHETISPKSNTIVRLLPLLRQLKRPPMHRPTRRRFQAACVALRDEPCSRCRVEFWSETVQSGSKQTQRNHDPCRLRCRRRLCHARQRDNEDRHLCGSHRRPPATANPTRPCPRRREAAPRSKATEVAGCAPAGNQDARRAQTRTRRRPPPDPSTKNEKPSEQDSHSPRC